MLAILRMFGLARKETIRPNFVAEPATEQFTPLAEQEKRAIALQGKASLYILICLALNTKLGTRGQAEHLRTHEKGFEDRLIKIEVGNIGKEEWRLQRDCVLTLANMDFSNSFNQSVPVATFGTEYNQNTILGTRHRDYIRYRDFFKYLGFDVFEERKHGHDIENNTGLSIDQLTAEGKLTWVRSIDGIGSIVCSLETFLQKIDLTMDDCIAVHDAAIRRQADILGAGDNPHLKDLLIDKCTAPPRQAPTCRLAVAAL